MKPLILGITFLFLSSAAAADIIGWQDTDGVRHYTNLKGEVPQEHQDSARVVVDEEARRPQAPEASAPQAGPERPPEQRHEAEVVYDRSQVTSAYLEGLQRGLDAARTINAGGGVQISGPLAVANASSPLPRYEYAVPYAYPFVTTSFDRGRSRHLTLRMLLQDQFAVDREAPFIFEERFIPPFGHPPLGVDLNPFLPRGLPHGFPRQTRVIAR